MEEDVNDVDDYDAILAYALPQVQVFNNKKEAKKSYEWVPGRYGSKASLKDDFVQLKYPLFKTIRNLARPKMNCESSEDYTEVFLPCSRIRFRRKV